LPGDCHDTDVIEGAALCLTQAIEANGGFGIGAQAVDLEDSVVVLFVLWGLNRPGLSLVTPEFG